ncbi:MAG: Ig-like domain-containing protein [Gemmatimonadales bacterium]
MPHLVGVFAVAAAISTPGKAQTVAEVQVTPETMTLGVGQKQALFATAFDRRGNLIAAAKFTFWSSDSLIAEVRKDGTVVGIKPGLAKIEARSQGKRASLAVLITGSAPGEPAGTRPSTASVLTLEPPALTLMPGETARIRAQALKEDGSPVSIGRVTIKSLKPDVARVDSGGLVTGTGVGRTILQAASAGLMATLPVEVIPGDFTVSPASLGLGVDQADTLHALVPSRNRELKGVVQWRSSDTSVVEVTSTGVVRGRSAGKAEIIGTAFTQERRATITVHATPDALVVSPHHGTLQLPLRSKQQFSAVAEAADSTPLADVRVNWELSDTLVARFDPVTGILTPKALGTTTLTARLPGITPAVWTIQVVTGEITIEPARIGLLVGQRATFSAVPRDQDASVTRTAAIKWTSDRAEAATVRENGQVEALAPGHAVVTALTPWGKQASADVFVVADLFLSSNRRGSSGIYQMRVPGPLAMLPVLVDSATNIQAAPGPERTRVAFSSNRTGSFDLYLMDADGQRLRRLTSSSGGEGEPAWTPDGGHIVYTATTGTATQVWIVNADGGDNRQLTTASGGNHSPSVSPDGRTIAFVSARSGNHAVYTMNIDGTSQRRLTKGSARETNPGYVRNGDLFYVVERGGGSKGSRVMRLTAGNGNISQVLQTDEPISSLAVSREGDRLAYVVGQIRDAAKGRVEFSLFLQTTSSRNPPVNVPLQPGEQILSPSF